MRALTASLNAPTCYLNEVHRSESGVVPIYAGCERSAADIAREYAANGTPSAPGKAGAAVHDDLSSYVVFVQQSSKDRPAWVLNVNGGKSAMQQVLSCLAAGGAIRNDFHEVYEGAGRMLGKGSFATVCSYQAIATQQKVAAKAFKEPEEQDDFLLILGEIRTWAKLPPHPNMLSLRGVFRQPSADAATSWFLVTDHCGNGDLYRFLQEGGPCVEEDAMFIMRGVFSALRHMHYHGVIHRDVKPENILLLDGGEVALCDFGIAVSMDDINELTKARGTPGYVSPEVILRSGTTALADVFSAGLVFFYMLCNKNPFKGANCQESLRNTTSSKVNFDQYKRFADITPQTKSFIKKLLAKEAAKRPHAEEALGHVQSCILTEELSRSRRLLSVGNKEQNITTLSAPTESEASLVATSCTAAQSTQACTDAQSTQATNVSGYPKQTCEKAVQASDCPLLQDRLSHEKSARSMSPPALSHKRFNRKMRRKLHFGLDPKKFATDFGWEDDQGDSSRRGSDEYDPRSCTDGNDTNHDIDTSTERKISKPSQAKPTEFASRPKYKRHVRVHKLDATKFVTDSVWECTKPATDYATGPYPDTKAVK